jgi:hypothetical protein
MIGGRMKIMDEPKIAPLRDPTVPISVKKHVMPPMPNSNRPVMDLMSANLATAREEDLVNWEEKKLRIDMNSRG